MALPNARSAAAASIPPGLPPPTFSLPSARNGVEPVASDVPMQSTVVIEPICARHSQAMAAVRVARRRGDSSGLAQRIRRGGINAPPFKIVNAQ